MVNIAEEQEKVSNLSRYELAKLKRKNEKVQERQRHVILKYSPGNTKKGEIKRRQN